MVTCYQQKKVLSSQNVLLQICLQMRYLIWWYAELNCLLVGSGLIPLNIELQQDNRTVCCGHTAVGGLRVNSCSVKGGLIIFPLFLLKGNAILRMTPKADYDS